MQNYNSIFDKLETNEEELSEIHLKEHQMAQVDTSLEFPLEYGSDNNNECKVFEHKLNLHKPLVRTVSKKLFTINNQFTVNNCDIHQWTKKDILIPSSSNRSESPLCSNNIANVSEMDDNLPKSHVVNDSVNGSDRPMCPPTPTHHARRLINSAEIVGQLDANTPTEQQLNESMNEHITSTRLPSIPEQARGDYVQVESLPPACEARMDSHGRIFYIDHATRTTSWIRPGNKKSFSVPEQQRQQLDRRYQSIRRTVYDRQNHSCTITNGDNQNSLQDLHPACLLIVRSDFYSMLHKNERAIEVWTENPTLKHMISRIRRDSNSFSRYQHNRDLVILCNCFAMTDKELPSGWEMKLDSSGKVSYSILLKFLQLN